MLANAQTKRQAIGGRTLVLLFLLALSVFINYVDRGNLSVAAPILKGELHLSASQLGVLLGAFFWTYTGVMILAGWMVDRFNVGRVLAGGLVVWSAATVATGLVSGFVALLCFRMLLGVGESVAFPSYGKILAQHVSQEHRGLANGMIVCGMSLGPAVGTLDWPLLHQLRFLSHDSWASLLSRQRMPSLHDSNGSRNHRFYLVYALGSPALSWIADSCIRRGANANFVRKTSMAIGHAVVASGLLGLAAADARTSFSCLIVMAVGNSFIGPNIHVFAQTFAGPAVAGRCTGLQNCLGNLVGVVVGPLTGWVVDQTGHFWWALVLAATVVLMGGASWVFLTGPLAQLKWPSEVLGAEGPLLAPAAR